MTPDHILGIVCALIILASAIVLTASWLADRNNRRRIARKRQHRR